MHSRHVQPLAQRAREVELRCLSQLPLDRGERLHRDEMRKNS